MKRRDFLKLTSSATGLTALSSLGVPLSLFAQGSDSLTGYKALVVLVQHGGNDSINTFIPSGTDSKKSYDNYASIRTSLAVSNNDLSSLLTQSNGKLSLTSNPYASNSNIIESYKKGFYRHSNIDGLATNAMMPEIADLVNKNNVAIIANTGNLIEPLTKTQMQNKTGDIPPYLFSHNSQRKLLFNGVASTLNRQGWAGLLADDWKLFNGDSVYGFNISISGVSHLLYGKNSEPLILKSSGPTKYSYIRRAAYDDWLSTSQNDNYKNLYRTLRENSFKMQDTVVDDWNNNTPSWSSTNVYGETLFSLPSNDTLGIGNSGTVRNGLIKQLEAVAKLAYIGKNSGLKRQVFYVSQGGYDTHANQEQNHPQLLRELSLDMGDFQRALEEMGMENEVTTFNLSDFGRTMGNNGDGTDHAWGAHHFVVGGAVNGGLYGILPDLTLGGEDDSSSKGRLIPTTSMSQYLETIVKWFGTDESTLSSLFPERANFSTKDLGFMS